MKKYVNKRNILICLAIMFTFFSIFKYIKGKSFFDTIVEYSNNIYSINAEVVNAKSEDILTFDNEYIPAQYTDYEDVSNSLYVVKKESSENLYLYNIKSKQESLFEEIDSSVIVSDIISNRYFIVWLEIDSDGLNDNKRVWNIYYKKVDDGKKTLIDSGEFEAGYDDDINRLIFPDGFSLDNNNLVYRKYESELEKKNNIQTKKVVSQIIYFNLNNNKLEVIDTSNDLTSEILHLPIISMDNIVWQSIKIDSTNDFKSTDVFVYNINNKTKNKKISTQSIKSLDIKNEHVVVATENPSEIIIFNLKNNDIKILFYKGSKAEKFIKEEDGNIDILKVKFINSNYILIDVLKEDVLSSVVYDINEGRILNFEKYMEQNNDTKSGVFYSSDSFRLAANLGFVILNDNVESPLNLELMEQNEEDIKADIEESNIDQVDIGIYYKINKYLLK